MGAEKRKERENGIRDPELLCTQTVTKLHLKHLLQCRNQETHIKQGCKLQTSVLAQENAGAQSC